MGSDIPADALVVLIGAAASGKSTWARHRFAATQILSSDAYRAVVADDDLDQGATQDAFEVLELVASKRLSRGLLTVVDATNLEPWTRYRWIDLAARHRRPAVAITFDVALDVLLERNGARGDRGVRASVLKQQARQMRSTLRALAREGFARFQPVAEEAT